MAFYGMLGGFEYILGGIIIGMNITEKILAKASGNKVVKAGEIVIAKVDKAMMDDILGPRVEIAEKIEGT